MTQRIAYTLFDPTGNITLLVETPVPEVSQPLLARKLMEREPETEQVGFVFPAENGIGLRMAGGEFCGNASMCAAALTAARDGRTGGEVTVYVSGTPKPVEVSVKTLPERVWQGSVMMPQPTTIGRELLPGGRELPVVRFPGITHILLEEEPVPETAERLAREWCAYLNSDALGLMFLNREEMLLKPLVYVPSAETLFWESSCASGTTAVGAFLAAESGRTVTLALKQQGGTLEIAARPGGNLLLTGTVRAVRQVRDITLSD